MEEVEIFELALRKTLKKTREAYGKTQAEMEETLDITSRYWGKLERGNRKIPNAYTLFKMYRKDLDINALFDKVLEEMVAIKSNLDKSNQ